MLRCLFGALYVDMRLFWELEACPDIKSDGLTKEDKAQDKNAEKANRYHVFPFSTNNLFPYQPMFVNYFHTTQNQYMVFWL